MTVNSQQILDTLAARYRDTLARHLGDCDDVVLLDFPNHANVGDSLIWLGEIAALRQLGKTVRHVCSIWDYDPAALAAVLSERTAILLHGGGNLGTIWPQHQALREAVLRDFPQHKVIQLSQSIHFKDEADAAAFGSLARGHRHFVLFARDHVSQAFACRVFDCAVELVPDSALVLRPRPSKPRRSGGGAPGGEGDGDGPAALKRLSRSAGMVDRLEVPGRAHARTARCLSGAASASSRWCPALGQTVPVRATGACVRPPRRRHALGRPRRSPRLALRADHVLSARAPEGRAGQYLWKYRQFCGHLAVGVVHADAAAGGEQSLVAEGRTKESTLSCN
ncbi:MAG: polysaccharide pyruvyl transferase family protein [Burkholderiaceae bacterium]|nr:polysaccharide pyruvyl transferase family protein [Burkholderiaceae bacterium]